MAALETLYHWVEEGKGKKKDRKTWKSRSELDEVLVQPSYSPQGNGGQLPRWKLTG